MPVLFTFSVEEAPSADPLADDIVLMTFEKEAVVDSKFSNPNTYTVTRVSSEGQDVAIRGVIVPKNSRTTKEVALVLDKPTHGAHYRITASNLNGRDGNPVGGSGDFIGRRTKTEDMIRVISSHYNTAPDSVIRQVLTAIGVQDDIIGGSRNDFFV